MSADYLNLSDDEILNLDLDALEEETPETGAEAEEATAEAAESVDTEEETLDEDNVDGSTGDLGEPDDDDGSPDVVSDESTGSVDAFSNGSGTDVDAPESPSEPESSTTDIDYKAEYNKLLKPFKANGKEVKVDNVDEAIQLMQMGANYNKKMTALKPNLKLLKMLENNGLLDESKLSYLIDLDKKDPGAIQKLIKDSGIDPLDVDPNEPTSYQPRSYTVSDKQLDLDAVLEEIQDTPTYSKTIDVVSNKWDSASRKVLIEHPGLIKLINEHMDNGIYAQIDAVIEKERMLGNLEGLSDLEAYRKVGDQLFAQAQASSPQAAQPVRSTPTAKPQPDPKVANRKRAAAPTKGRPAAKSVPDFDPLSMSDAEFEKLSPKFI